jgi:putative transposase
LEALESAEASESVRIEALAETLSDRPRSGRPPTFTAEQVCQIVALACELPTESGREVTHWTPQELAQEAQKRGLVESISVRTVGRFFERPR